MLEDSVFFCSSGQLSQIAIGQRAIGQIDIRQIAIGRQISMDRSIAQPVELRTRNRRVFNENSPKTAQLFGYVLD